MWSRACPAIFREKGSPPGDAGQQASPVHATAGSPPGRDYAKRSYWCSAANGVDGAGLARLSSVVGTLYRIFRTLLKYQFMA